MFSEVTLITSDVKLFLPNEIQQRNLLLHQVWFPKRWTVTTSICVTTCHASHFWCLLVSLAGTLLLKCTKCKRSSCHIISLSCYPHRPSLNKTWSTWQYRFHVGWAIWHGERLFTKTWLPETVCKWHLTSCSPLCFTQECTSAPCVTHWHLLLKKGHV